MRRGGKKQIRRFDKGDYLAIWLFDEKKGIIRKENSWFIIKYYGLLFFLDIVVLRKWILKTAVDSH